MFCTQCGTNVNNETKFCPNCGTQIINNSTGFFSTEPETSKVNKNILIKDLSIALPIYKYLSELYDQIIVLQYKQHKHWPISLCLFLFFIAWIFLYMIADLIVPFFPALYTPSASLTLVTVLFILAILFVVYMKSCAKKLYQKKIEHTSKQMEDYLKEHDCAELYVLPEFCQNYVAAEFIYNCLTLGRADSLKEAMNLYTYQLQIWHLEENQKQFKNELDRHRFEIECQKRETDFLSAFILFKQ